MNKLDQVRTETLLDLFEHDGWTIVISELEDLIKYSKENAHYLCITNDEWQQHKGKLLAMESFIGFETLTKAVAEQDALEGETDV